MTLHSISKILENTTKLTTHLTAQPAPWSDVAGTYDLDFGRGVPFNSPQNLNQRRLWGDVVNVGKDVLNAAEGNAELSRSVNFDVSVGHQGQTTNIYTDDQGRLILDCINCFVTGSFQVTGHLSVHNFDLQDLTLTASPNNFQAELELEATITSSESPDSLQYTKELFSFPIPDAGIEVEGIFKLGATLSYDVGVSSYFAGSATVDFGLQASLPNSAQLTADVQNPDHSSANGFGGGDLTPTFDIKKESASITLAAFSQPKLAFGIELIEVGNFDVAITIKLPEVSVTLSAEYDEGGVCSQSPGSSQTGVKLDRKADIEVELQIDASLGNYEETAKPSWSKALFSVSRPLGSMCFPLDIPGLNGTTNATQMPALSSLSQSATVSAVTSIPYAGKTSSLRGSGTSILASASSYAPVSSSTARASFPLSSTIEVSGATNSVTAYSNTASSLTTGATTLTSGSSASQTIPTWSSSTTAAVAKTTTSAASGGGSCRMLKRLSKRMLVC